MEPAEVSSGGKGGRIRIQVAKVPLHANLHAVYKVLLSLN
jgi:hypothetical protein